MTQTGILLVGAGGHARACIDVIELEGAFRIVGLIGRVEEVGTEVLGYPVIGSDVDLPAILGKGLLALVTVGQIKSVATRMRLFELIKSHGGVPRAIVSPRAHVSTHARVGAGTIVMHGAIVNAAAVVGANCIINSHALVEHDAIISDHCHVSTGARLNSGVRVGTGTFVGSGAVVRQQLSIGEHCVIGMGECVRTDCEPGTLLAQARRHQ